jgi:putative molybdopterin biosynthesis protein
MSIYLNDIPLPEALLRIQNSLERIGQWEVLGVEEIPLDERAIDRIVAEPLWAKISSPHYHASAMDGFAVRSSETEGAFQTNPITLTYGTQAEYVDTGDPLPGWANAVIMIENVEPLDDSDSPAENPRNPAAIRIRGAVPPWYHVRPMGEDMVATQLVLPAGHKLRAFDLGAIAGCGHSMVKVARKPKIAIIPTGTELKEVGEPVVPGDIIEYNSIVLAAQINSWGGEAVRLPIIKDDFIAIKKQVLGAAQEADLILLNAGSSAGSEDYSAKVIESLGDLVFHGVAVRPGHPVIFCIVEQNRSKDYVSTEQNSKKTNNKPDSVKTGIPVFGVPGYPVSAALTGEIFVEPVIAKWLGRQPMEPVEVEATLTRKITSPSGDDDYLRMTVGKVGDRVLAAPLSRGSGVITSLVRADGITIIPHGSQGLSAGEKVKVRLYCQPGEIDKTIFALGSHDFTLDIMAQFLFLQNRRLASANLGSLGGLVALRRRESHLAGSHLLDPETGEYNISYIKEYLKDVPVRVVSLVNRSQGLIITKGNTMGLKGLDDLVREDIRIINRQRGSGTRVLLDYQLGKLGIDVGSINGYELEEYTHLGVAAAVASDRADCGLGVEAAATGLHLDFIPLFQERYDLVIPVEFAESELLSPLFDLLENEAFKEVVRKMPGYDVSRMGKIIAELS